jgi:hypothetical protein
MTVSFALAVPLAPTGNDPLDGLTVTPLGAFAVQVTVCARFADDRTDSMVVPDWFGFR